MEEGKGRGREKGKQTDKGRRDRRRYDWSDTEIFSYLNVRAIISNSSDREAGFTDCGSPRVRIPYQITFLIFAIWTN